MGLMLGTEMVWKRMRSYGMQVLVITLTESLGTFVVVSAAFCTIFYLTGVPMFLGLIFGGIALATAPAPALSIVTEYHTDGPVTRTLIPLAVLDDVAAIAVFLGVMSVVLQQTAGGNIPGYLILLVVLFPVLIGVAVGMPVSALLRRSENKKRNAVVVLLGVLAEKCGCCASGRSGSGRTHHGGKCIFDAFPHPQLYAHRNGLLCGLFQPHLGATAG